MNSIRSTFVLSQPSIYEIFFERWTKKHVPDESTLRKNHVRPLYTAVVAKIRSVVTNNSVCFIMDEATDSKKRFVLNILVALLTAKFD